MPRRILWPLTAAVLALHLLALRGLPVRPTTPQGAPPQALSTRLLPPPAPAAQPPAATPPTAPRRAAAPRPAPRRKAPPTAAPAPAEPPAPAAYVEPPAPAQAAAIDPETAGWLDQVAANTLPGPAGAGAQPPAQQPAPPQEAAPAPSAAQAPEPAPQTTAPLPLPPSTQLSFQVKGRVKGFDYTARAELLWRTDGNRYQLRQKVSAFLLGSRAQESSGSVTARGLQPERFVDEGRSTRSAQLDFAAHSVRFSDGASGSAAISDGAQDRLSVFLQLGALLAADPGRYPPGTRIAFETVGVRRVDRWVFAVEGPQTLDLPIGETPALKLQRLPQGDGDQQDELWLGTALHYLPVRIRLAQGQGDHVELLLSDHAAP